MIDLIPKRGKRGQVLTGNGKCLSPFRFIGLPAGKERLLGLALLPAPPVPGATGLGAGVFWMLAAMPARVWIRLVRQNASLVWAGIFIIAAAWILGFLTNRAWAPLIGPTFRVVERLLLAFGQEVVSQPAGLLLGTPQFAVEIYPACAGYEGIGLISVFVGSYLWLFRGSLRFPQAFILLPCGILVIWLVNAVRITLLVLFGTYVSPQSLWGGVPLCHRLDRLHCRRAEHSGRDPVDALLRRKAIGRNGGPGG